MNDNGPRKWRTKNKDFLGAVLTFFFILRFFIQKTVIDKVIRITIALENIHYLNQFRGCKFALFMDCVMSRKDILLSFSFSIVKDMLTWRELKYLWKGLDVFGEFNETGISSGKQLTFIAKWSIFEWKTFKPIFIVVD